VGALKDKRKIKVLDKIEHDEQYFETANEFEKITKENNNANEEIHDKNG
jgi:hypothetical protein